MTRNRIAMSIVAAVVLLQAGCTKEEVSPSQASPAGTKNNVKATNLIFPFIEKWIQASTPTPAMRKYAIGFALGTKGYMGGGEGYFPGQDPNYAQTMNDFWEYDPAGNTWTQRADMLFPLERAATFVIGTRGFVCTGQSFTSTQMTLSNALYMYDQASNTWHQRSSLPASSRCDAVGLNIGDSGYVGTGSPLTTANYRDWWLYDPRTDHWTQRASMPGTFGRAMASSFSIGQYGFVACGEVYASAYDTALWMYSPAINRWTRKANLPASSRYYATGFNYGSYGALTCGEFGGYLNDFWYYDLNTDTWHSDLSMGGGARSKAVGFAINGIPYVGTGETNPYNYLSDFWYLAYVKL